MKTDTKRQLLQTGATVGIIAAALTGGIYLSEQTLAPPVPVVFEVRTVARSLPAPSNGPRFTCQWGHYLTPEDVRAGWVTELYATTNFRFFYYVGDTTSNRVTISAPKEFEGFVIRHRHTNSGYVTGWNRKL